MSFGAIPKLRQSLHFAKQRERFQSIMKPTEELQIISTIVPLDSSAKIPSEAIHESISHLQFVHYHRKSEKNIFQNLFFILSE